MEIGFICLTLTVATAVKLNNASLAYPVTVRWSEEPEVEVRLLGEAPLIRNILMEYVQNLIDIYNDSDDEDERAELVAELNEIYKISLAFING